MVSSLEGYHPSCATTVLNINHCLKKFNNYFSLCYHAQMGKNKALLLIIKKVGSMTELARILGCSKSSISLWANGKSPIPTKYLNILIKLSGNKVLKKDLRPDLYELE